MTGQSNGENVDAPDRDKGVAAPPAVGPITVAPAEPVTVDVTAKELASDWLKPPVQVPFEQTRKVLEGAELVSKGLLWIFGVAVLLALLMPLIFLIAAGGDVQQATVWSQEYAKLLKEIGGFGATLFGPLLAFVLGFYFKDRMQK